MKHISRLFALALLLAVSVSAMGQDLKIFKLRNGMTVYVWEDHTQPDVMGQVVVRTGSVNDPEQYTGLAHYLEHMMFKGTTTIGALDWASEQPIYEQIIAKYDEMAETSDPAAKAEIFKKINELTIEEGKISLSQEYADLVQYIGGNSLNAATSYDQTVYYNVFPSHQISRWLFMASERFINPVFRAFQSELETVYEEYNMYSDNGNYQAQEFMLSKAFEGTPYARPVIGLPEHIKNPRLSELTGFYNRWYVPENMALILAGDVNTESVFKLIGATFGRLRPAGAAFQPQIIEDKPIRGKTQHKIKLGDYPMVFMICNGLKAGDADEAAFDVCMNLLTNSAGSGLFDKLVLDGSVLSAMASPYAMKDVGRTIFMGIPMYNSMTGGFASNKDVERLMSAEIRKIAAGDFNPAAVEPIKAALKRDFELGLENNSGKVSALCDVFVNGKDPSDVIEYGALVDKVTIEDVKRVAKQYLTDDCIVIYNDGGPAQRGNKINMPKMKPIEPPTGKTSPYAQQIKSLQTFTPKENFADWSKVQEKQINSYSRFYYTKNEVNDIFTLTLKYGANSKLFPKLEAAATLMETAGIMAQYSSQQLREEFNRLGATFSIGSNSEYLTITLRGYEDKLKDACMLLSRLVLMPALDSKQLGNVIGGYAAQRLSRKKNTENLGDALNEYLVYGDESSYKKELTDRQIVDLDISSLTGEFIKATHYAAEIHYSGVMSCDEAYEILSTSLPLVADELPSSSPRIRPMAEYTDNTVLFLPSDQAKQAQIYFYIPMGDYDKSMELGRLAFNQYFSGGFNGLAMQEIREKNSMAYTTYGNVRSRQYPGSKVYFQGYIGTQNEKTVDAVKLFMSLLTDMPEHPENIDNIKKWLKETLLNESLSPRVLSQIIANWKLMGYTDDPARELVKAVDSLTFEDIRGFYDKYIKGKPIAIGIVANPKEVDAKALEAFGKVEKLRPSAVFNSTDVLF